MIGTHCVNAQRVFHLGHTQKPPFWWKAHLLHNVQEDLQNSCGSLLIMYLSEIIIA